MRVTNPILLVCPRDRSYGEEKRHLQSLMSFGCRTSLQSLKKAANIRAKKEYRIKDRMNQSSDFVRRLAGITAKTVIKSLIPGSEHGLKQNLKVFIRQIASTAIL